MTSDTDRNKNFKDNERHFFKIKDKAINDKSRMEATTVQDYFYEIYSEGKVKPFHRKIIVYPSVFHGTKITSLSFKYNYIDYWEGKLNLDNQDITFYYQGIDNNRGGLFVKPDTIDFKNKEEDYKIQFQYYKGDTILINKRQFQFDSVNSTISKLYLRQLKKLDKNYGNYAGTYLENGLITDFQENSTTTDLILREKQYTLIDFWASWCGPCIEGLPKIKQIQEKYKTKLNVIGFSTDVSSEKAREIIMKHNMTWQNFYGNFKTKINQNLNIEMLPTLLLIDSKGKIMYRGTSESEIIKILEK